MGKGAREVLQRVASTSEGLASGDVEEHRKGARKLLIWICFHLISSEFQWKELILFSILHKDILYDHILFLNVF